MQSIIFIGPYGVGKTTVAECVAQKLGLPKYSLDDNPWKYYRQQGLDLASAEELGDIVSPLWQPFYAYAVEMFIKEHEHECCIMDFGVGHAIYDGDLLRSIYQLLVSYNVVLLTPSDDVQESIQNMAERNDSHSYKRTQDHRKWNKYFIEHQSGYSLAKFVVYTKDKLVEEICLEVINKVTKM